MEPITTVGVVMSAAQSKAKNAQTANAYAPFLIIPAVRHVATSSESIARTRAQGSAVRTQKPLVEGRRAAPTDKCVRTRTPVYAVLRMPQYAVIHAARQGMSV